MNIKTKRLIQHFHKHIYIDCPHSTLPPPSVEFAIKIGGLSIVGKEMKFLVKFMTLVTIAIASATDAAGNAVDTALLEVVTWASSDESIATIDLNEAGQIVVTPTGKAGTVQISATGDSDPNTPEGFAGMVELTFLPGEVAVVNLSVATNDNVTQVT